VILQNNKETEGGRIRNKKENF